MLNLRGFGIKYTYLNMKKDLPLNYNKVITKTEDNMKGVQMFFDHIKEILCSNIEEEYSVVKKFLASSCAGHKVKIALYMQSLEQSGKGTVLNFMNKLLGSRMCKTSNTETVERYNKEFEGCTLINLDELPVAGTNKPLQDILKALITEPTFSCRGMYSAPYTQKNTFNICLSTNNNGISLTQTNHIRYYVLTISHKYCEISTEKAKKEKKEYFDKLYKYLDNEDIQILIFQEFMRIYNEEVKPSNWTGAYENLNTTAGKIKRMDAMPEFFKNLKKDYLSNGLGIDERCSTFIDTYNMSAKLKLTPHKIGDFLKMLNVDIKEVKRGGESKFRKYVISYENLLKRFKELNYIDPVYDDFSDNPDDIEKEENPFDEGIIKTETKIETISKSEYDKLFKEYETLKLQLEALKFNQEVQQVDQEMTKQKKINKSTKNITKKEKVNKSTKNSKSIINIETKESNADDSESEIKNIIDDIEIF